MKSIILQLVLLISLIPCFTEAAVLYLEPREKEYHQGDIFIQEIRLDTEGEYINSVEIGISFPKDIIRVKDSSIGNSILTLWVEEPRIEDDIISFVGGIPGGYQGWDGLLAKIIFEVAERDSSELELARIGFLETSQVLINDGFGTQTELETQGASLTILPKTPSLKNEWQEELVREEIIKKSRIIYNGALKRGKQKVYEYFRGIEEKYLKSEIFNHRFE